VRLFIAASLDGRIAGPHGEIDWLFHDQDYGYTDFARTVDTVLMGRKSYEASLAFGEWPYPGMAAWVFTRHPEAVADDRVTFTDRPPAEVVAGIRKAKGRDLWLLGGGGLVRAFLDAGLVDEMVVAIHPLVLGRGIPLFPEGTRRTALRLKDSRAYETGLVMLSYEVRRPSRSGAPLF
jgi:dihydrofolate reductase